MVLLIQIQSKYFYLFNFLCGITYWSFVCVLCMLCVCVYVYEWGHVPDKAWAWWSKDNTQQSVLTFHFMSRSLSFASPCSLGWPALELLGHLLLFTSSCAHQVCSAVSLSGLSSKWALSLAFWYYRFPSEWVFPMGLIYKVYKERTLCI